MRTWTSPIAAPLAAVFAFAVSGCKDSGTLPAKPDNLGQQVVEAIANVPSKPPPSGYPWVYVRGVRPLDLSEIAIVDSWNWNWGGFDDPDLAEALDGYARGGFPGIVMECDPDLHSKLKQACYPFSLDDLPPEGVLILHAGSNDSTSPPKTHIRASAVHYYVTASGQLDSHSYAVELERLEGGRWEVVEERYVCCS